MASKRGSKQTATDEIDELFEGIGDDAIPNKKTARSTAGSKPKPTDDILAELENQLGEKVPSRPHTPRIKDSSSASKTGPLKRSTTPTVERTSEDNNKPAAHPRKSADSARSFHASFTPSATSSELQESEKKGPVEQTQPAPASSDGGGGGGGWWGGLLSTASAAMKQANAAVKEIQQNEDAKKWADQVRGNVGALRGLGDGLAHRALPTFTNIINTLAPPISSHERLLIHITHDLVGYPSLDPLIYGVFSRVMAQVEGGDLLVIQRGHENSIKSPLSEQGSFFTGGSQSSAGWRDGPWWRDVGSPRDLGLIKGLIEGTKLCRASAEAYSAEYFSASGGIDAARRRAVQPLSESNPVRSSDLFLAVQAIGTADNRALFAGTASIEKEKESSAVMDPPDAKDDMVCFAVYVLDPVHEIQFSTLSQGIPARWARWLDAPSPLTPASGDDGASVPEVERVSEEIRDIVDSGAVDPREWVAEWVEEALSLAVGVVAQRYVARRMGVGEGGIDKGKRRMEEVVQEGGGEAARAGII